MSDYYKWTKEHINELKIKAKSFEAYILYSLYCNTLDEIFYLAENLRSLYDKEREFEQKYHNLYNILEKVQDEINDNFVQ